MTLNVVIDTLDEGRKFFDETFQNGETEITFEESWETVLEARNQLISSFLFESGS